MGLIFPRVAKNFVKNGYFPTDEDTLERVLSALDVGASRIRILDPCCGEGVALAEAKHHLEQCGAEVRAYGIEVDAERAWHAKRLLDVVAHADVHDVVVSPRSCGLLFLNPPYGDVVSDRAGTGDRHGRERHEKIFCRRTFPLLQFSGVLVLIVPHYVFDADLATLIARNFENVAVFMAPEQRFKQAVLFGTKRRSESPNAEIVKLLTGIGVGELPPTLPQVWPGTPYAVPRATADDNFAFAAVRLDAAQLEAELTRLQRQTLWPRFAQHFRSGRTQPRRPVRDLTRWHLALALAAGQITGLVRSPSGRTLLIKGDTYKAKDVHVEVEERDDGSLVETRVLTDKFVPEIKGIDFTPGPGFGSIVTIR